MQLIKVNVSAWTALKTSSLPILQIILLRISGCLVGFPKNGDNCQRTTKMSAKATLHSKILVELCMEVVCFTMRITIAFNGIPTTLMKTTKRVKGSIVQWQLSLIDLFFHSTNLCQYICGLALQSASSSFFLREGDLRGFNLSEKR